ncbi:MAG: hypothetical protein JHD16_13270 [Solirubrobacteraceae bacterium]|nr:hypothetical protein [Solirubrobacteraceae bacterium]
MPVSSASFARTSSAIAVAAATLGAPASAQAWSWQDLFKAPASAAPVTSTAADVTEPVTDVISDTTDTVAEVVDPGSAEGDTAPGCPETPVRQAFARFGDDADYSLAPGGDFEAAAGWKLTGGARLASGNENLGVQPGRRSLQLPIGATATSPQFCVDETNPHFRFVSKPDNAIAGYEAIVLYRSAEGSVTQAKFTSSASQSWGAGRWAPSSPSPLATKIPLLSGGSTASVQIMFVSTGNKVAVGVGLWGRLTGGSVGTVSVDSLMIDPYRRG